MKRREFIVASSTLVGGLAVNSARAALPCSPATMIVTGGGQATTPCVTGAAPSWYTSMNDGTWSTVAASANVAAVAPSPVPDGNTGQRAVMATWCGGVVDSTRQELQLPAQGGHNDYLGNEVYVLALNTSAPAWRRVSNPRYVFGSDSNAAMDDGSPRSMHGNSQLCYAENIDRTLIAPMTFCAPLGYSTSNVYAFDRSSNTWAMKASVPSGYGSGSGLSGGAVFDAVSGFAWLVGSQSDNSVCRYNPVTNTHTLYSGVPLWTGYSGTLAIAPSRRILIYIGGSVVNNDGSFKWLDLDNITAGWRSPAAVTGSPPTGYGPGMVWHGASGGFLCWDGSPATTVIKKLTPPGTLASGTWTWSNVAAASGNSVTPTARAGNGTFGRFNLIESLGGSGRDCLVLVNAVDQATYVYKLPVVGV